MSGFFNRKTGQGRVVKVNMKRVRDVNMFVIYDEYQDQEIHNTYPLHCLETNYTIKPRY